MREECDDTACGADCPHDEDTAREAITDDVLSVEVRTDWHTVGAVEACKPTHYKILLCWGGPAVQIIGTLDAYNQPDSAKLQYQDWFTDVAGLPADEGGRRDGDEVRTAVLLRSVAISNQCALPPCGNVPGAHPHTMHFRFLVTCERDAAETSEQAREYVLNTLVEEGFCSEGRWGGGVC